MATWDASTRAIYWHRVNERTEKQIGSADPLREIRTHLAGRLREAGRQTIDGREVIRLELANGLQPRAEGRVGDAVYAYAVDAHTYERRRSHPPSGTTTRSTSTCPITRRTGGC